MIKYTTLIMLAYLVTTLSGCAVYTGMSVTTAVTTGKSMSEHTASVITGYDCGVKNWIDHKHNWCEQRRDAGTNYVRSW
jgi:uncharacterized membrane protein